MYEGMVYGSITIYLIIIATLIVALVLAGGNVADFTTSSTDGKGSVDAVLLLSSFMSVLILFSLGSSGVNNTAAEARGYYRLMQGSTELYRMDIRSYDYGNSGSISFVAHGQSFLDSPATTSSVTYKIQQRSSTGTIRVCESNNQIQMQLLEIAQ